jgi:hypothetical protein
MFAPATGFAQLWLSALRTRYTVWDYETIWVGAKQSGDALANASSLRRATTKQRNNPLTGNYAK